MGCTLFWMKFGKAVAYFVVSCLLLDGAIIQYRPTCKYPNRVNFDCKTKLCLIVRGNHGKYILTKERFLSTR